MSAKTSRVTIDHDAIRKWVESRGGKPVRVKSTGDEDPGRDPGIIRIDFPGYSGGDSLEHISWDEFFNKFDESNLALVYQETTAQGKKSNFNKLVDRDSQEVKAMQ